MIAHKKPRLVFDGQFDEREAAESEAKGYRSNVWAELANGDRYEIVFYDAVRLAQDLADENCIAEPGLIVVESVTQGNMQAAIERLAEEGYFDSLRSCREIEAMVRR